MTVLELHKLYPDLSLKGIKYQLKDTKFGVYTLVCDKPEKSKNDYWYICWPSLSNKNGCLIDVEGWDEYMEIVSVPIEGFDI